MDKAKTRAVAFGNDVFRQTMIRTARHRVVMTERVAASSHQDAIVDAVRNYGDFKPSNDPHDEHDFGEFWVDGTKYFWKIDYYDPEFEFGVDPREEECARVLTIMEASEY